MTSKKLGIVGKTAACAAFLGLVVLGGSAVAGGDGPNQQAKGSSGAQVQGVEDSALAAQLAAYGQRTKDPLALILAAKIAKTTAASPLEVKPKTEGPEGAKADKKGTSALDAMALLDQAGALCGEDGTLKTLLARVKDEASRGAVGGPKGGSYILAGGCKNVFEVSFRGGEAAAVAVVGDGSTDLDIFVYDQNGNLIVSDTRASGACYVAWCPVWTGPFRLEICNLGSYANIYEIRTN
jgi:hypothetical protein